MSTLHISIITAGRKGGKGGETKEPHMAGTGFFFSSAGRIFDLDLGVW